MKIKAIYKIPQFLYSIGVNYYAEGSIKKAGRTIGHYFKVDYPTESQIKEITDAGLRLIRMGNTYAPERVHTAVCLMKRETVK